jgi:hypothetical protein
VQPFLGSALFVDARSKEHLRECLPGGRIEFVESLAIRQPRAERFEKSVEIGVRPVARSPSGLLGGSCQLPREIGAKRLQERNEARLAIDALTKLVELDHAKTLAPHALGTFPHPGRGHPRRPKMQARGGMSGLRSGRRSPAAAGRVIHEGSRWLVEHCVGPLGVGTLLVDSKRHVTRVAELTEQEAAELGAAPAPNGGGARSTSRARAGLHVALLARRCAAGPHPLRRAAGDAGGDGRVRRIRAAADDGNVRAWRAAARGRS